MGLSEHPCPGMPITKIVDEKVAKSAQLLNYVLFDWKPGGGGNITVYIP